MSSRISAGLSSRASSTSSADRSIKRGCVALRVVGGVSKSSVLAGEITVSILSIPSGWTGRNKFSRRGSCYDTLRHNNQKDLSHMPALRACVHYMDIITDRTGRLLAWLVLAMALLTTAVVVLRYGFNIGSIMAQEGVTYM